MQSLAGAPEATTHLPGAITYDPKGAGNDSDRRQYLVAELRAAADASGIFASIAISVCGEAWSTIDRTLLAPT